MIFVSFYWLFVTLLPLFMIFEGLGDRLWNFMIFQGYPGRTQVEAPHPVEGNMLIPWPSHSLTTDCLLAKSRQQIGKLTIADWRTGTEWKTWLSTGDWRTEGTWEQWLKTYASQPGGPWQAGAGGLISPLSPLSSLMSRSAWHIGPHCPYCPPYPYCLRCPYCPLHNSPLKGIEVRPLRDQ